MKKLAQFKIRDYFKYGQNPLIFINLILIFYGVGVYLAKNDFWHWEHPFLMLSITIVISMVLIWYKKWIGCLGLLCFILILGNVRGDMYFQVKGNNISHFINMTAPLKGVIVDEPKVKFNGERQFITYVVKAQELAVEDNKYEPVQGKVYLFCAGGADDPVGKIGDEIQASGQVKGLGAYHNPGLIDGELRALGQGIYATYLAYQQPVKIIPSNKFSLQEKTYELRQKVLNFFVDNLPDEKGYMLYGMIFGGYTGLRGETVEAFTGAGIVHMLAVSGAHIAILAGFIMLLGRLLKLPNWGKLLLLMVILFLYGMMCGFKPSVIRAIIMGLLTVSAMCLDRQADGKNVLSITALLMVLVDPLLLYNISFQLSFAATAGLIYLMRPLSRLFSLCNGYLGDSMALTLAVQLGTAPLLAWYFNNISIAAFISNLLIIPLLEICIILGMNCGWLCFVSSFLASKLLIIVDWVLTLANLLIVKIAGLPMAKVYLSTFSTEFLLLYYFLMYLFLKDKLRSKIWAGVKNYKIWALGIGCACLLGGIYYAQQPKPLAIHCIDLNQGEGMLVVTPHGHAVVIDPGGLKDRNFDLGSRVMVPYLRHYGVNKVDYLILSNPQVEYSGGAKGLINKVPVEQLIFLQDKKANYAQVLDLTVESPLVQNAILGEEGKDLVLDGVHFAFITVENEQGKELGNVIKLTYGKFAAIFPGNLSQEGEQELVATNYNLHATMLKVSHHGANIATSKEFVAAVGPSYGVITCGKNNEFGYPQAETLTTLAKAQVNLYRTDESGAIVFYTNGKTVKVDPYLPKKKLVMNRKKEDEI